MRALTTVLAVLAISAIGGLATIDDRVEAADSLVSAGRTPWGDPERLLSARRKASRVDVASGRRGYAVVVWTSGADRIVPENSPPRDNSQRRIFASVRQPHSEGFGRPEAISPRGARGGQVETAPNGDTVVTWLSAAGRVQAVFGRPGASFRERQTLSGRGASAPSAAIAPDGTAIAAWSARRGGFERIEAAVRVPRASFGPPQILATSPGLGPFLAVTAGRKGRGAVAWSRSCPAAAPAGDFPAQASIALPGGVFGPAEAIPNSKCPNAGLELGMDAEGRVTALINGFMDRGVIKASFRAVSGVFTPAERISVNGGAYFGELGVARDGAAVAVWDGGRRGIEAAVRQPGGAFGAPLRVSTRGRVGLLDLAVSPNGHAVAAWQSLRSYRFKATYSKAGFRFSSPERASSPLRRGVLAEPRVAISPAGRALLAWSRSGRGGGPRGVFVADRGHE